MLKRYVTISPQAEVMRCGASCLLAPVALSAGASKQLAPHFYTAKLLLKYSVVVMVLWPGISDGASAGAVFPQSHTKFQGEGRNSSFFPSCFFRVPLWAEDLFLDGSIPPLQKSEKRININSASVEELMQLPGIGQKLAERIIAHRARHGAFKRPQDIIIVRGMSARRYRQIAHLIRT